MTILTEKTHAGEFLISEASGTRSRDKIILIALAGALSAGQVLGKITKATATAAALGTNVGNGTIGTITVGNGSQPGAYVVTLLEPATNLGAFSVEAPDGSNIGHGTVGTAFSAGGLGFTLADGSTDFSAGDQFKITIAAGSGKYAVYNPVGTDGRETAVAILYAAADASAADAPAVAVTRDSEVDASLLTSLDAAARISLAAAGIIVR